MSFSLQYFLFEEQKTYRTRNEHNAFYTPKQLLFCLPYLGTTLLVKNMFIDRQQFGSEGFQVSPGPLPDRRNAASFRQA